MRIVFNVSVMADVPTYTHAGQLLDQVDGAVEEVLKGKGHHDITNFQTRPCKEARFNEISERSMMAMPEDSPPSARWDG